MSQRIEARYSICDIPTPLTTDKDSDVDWICKCFGFTEPRDKNKTAAKIFAALVEAIKEKGSISSDELAEKVGVTRAAVVHHLNRMMGSGLVVRRHGSYQLRMQGVESTVVEVQRDILRVFENLRKVSREIDEAMNIPHRQSV
jgi:predicted transcriptional regulator